jgi:hypothetical protein
VSLPASIVDDNTEVRKQAALEMVFTVEETYAVMVVSGILW